jgi:inner membrane protein
MMFVTHISFALLLGLSALRLSPLPVNRHLFLATIAFASLLPDIDTGTSLLGKWFRLASPFFRHRGIVHSLLSMIVCSIAFLFLAKNFYYSLAFAAGYLSHLLLDSMTPSGVAMFWPRKKRSRGKIYTTGIWDFLILFALIAMDLLLIAS